MTSQKAGEIIMTTVRSSRKIQLSLFLWVLGLFTMFFAPAPGVLSPEMEKQYDSLVTRALTVPGYDLAMSDVQSSQAKVSALRSEQSYSEWISSCFGQSENAPLQHARERLTRTQATLDQLESQKDQLMAQARAAVGVWSSYGVEEMRFRFWSAFHRGKVFAQRQTFWQMFWSVLDSRENNVLGLVLQWLITALFNFALSLTGAFIYFLMSLFELVQSFSPSWTSGLGFVLVSSVAGASVVFSTLLALGLVGLSGVVAVSQLAMSRPRGVAGPGPRHGLRAG